MLNLTRVIDRATGYVYVPPESTKTPPEVVESPDAPTTQRPNAYALFSTAAGQIKGKYTDVRDVQERWIDAKDEWDAFERREWRTEGERIRDESLKKEAKTKKTNTVRTRT